jgi:hypothetical protein
MDIVLWTDMQTARTKGTVWLRHLFCIFYFFSVTYQSTARPC